MSIHETTLNGKYARALDINRFGSKEVAITYLVAMRCYANELLQVKGRVFLNDVYEMLGLPISEVGKHVGWRCDGENYIDFKVRPNGMRVSGNFIMLDFNVDGIID